jgi:hypothetical protein
MSEHVSHLLELFDTLSEPDKRSAVVEILRRSPPGETDIPPSAHDALAAELFAALDTEEAARASGR